MRIKFALCVAVLALLTTACAGQVSGERQFGGPDRVSEDEDGPPRPHVQLFISPSGQPFRAPAGQPYPSASWFAAADRDHDGRLTRDEFRADAEAWFKVIDVSGDGEVSMPEVTHWEEALVPEITRATFGGYGGGRGGALSRNVADTRAQGAAAYGLINEPHPIRGADADFSFGVSRAEWRNAADRRFDLLDDKDGVKDGAILLGELPHTPSQGHGLAKPGGKPPMRPPPPG